MRIFAFFADLKAAFDRVGREKLEERLKEIRVKEILGRRMKTYKETKNKIKVGLKEDYSRVVRVLDKEKIETGMFDEFHTVQCIQRTWKKKGRNRRSDDRKRKSMVNYKCRRYSATGKDGTRLKRNNKKILKISRKRD